MSGTLVSLKPLFLLNILEGRRSIISFNHVLVLTVDSLVREHVEYSGGRMVWGPGMTKNLSILNDVE